MTTGTTVLGLLPMALGLGAGSELQRPLSLTVIGGLSGSTLLTLLVIPCLYLVVSAPASPLALRAPGALPGERGTEGARP
jgi:HAE1 family hydrophobic/amphiphilic exporter-1